MPESKRTKKNRGKGNKKEKEIEEKHNARESKKKKWQKEKETEDSFSNTQHQMTQQRVDQHQHHSTSHLWGSLAILSWFPSSPSIFRRHPAELHTSFSISMVHTFLNFLEILSRHSIKNSCKFQIFQIFHFFLGESQVLGEIEKTSPRPRAPRPEGLAGRYSSPPPGRPKNTGRRCRNLLNPCENPGENDVSQIIFASSTDRSFSAPPTLPSSQSDMFYL